MTHAIFSPPDPTPSSEGVGLSQAINTINNDPSPRPHVVMAASTIMTIPIIILFLGMERYLEEGLSAGGVKG